MARNDYDRWEGMYHKHWGGLTIRERIPSYLKSGGKDYSSDKRAAERTAMKT